MRYENRLLMNFRFAVHLKLIFFVHYNFFPVPVPVQTRGGKSLKISEMYKKKFRIRNYIGSKESALLQVVRLFLSNV